MNNTDGQEKTEEEGISISESRFWLFEPGQATASEWGHTVSISESRFCPFEHLEGDGQGRAAGVSISESRFWLFEPRY